MNSRFFVLPERWKYRFKTKCQHRCLLVHIVNLIIDGYSRLTRKFVPKSNEKHTHCETYVSVNFEIFTEIYLGRSGQFVAVVRVMTVNLRGDFGVGLVMLLRSYIFISDA